MYALFLFAPLYYLWDFSQGSPNGLLGVLPSLFMIYLGLGILFSVIKISLVLSSDFCVKSMSLPILLHQKDFGDGQLRDLSVEKEETPKAA
ncbi:MAG: hypothetical protein HOE90_23610 [Bacteriovoracaceae bacterium]|nr:hypothetical protein [Bacteriovoracaceae bacterium]